MASVRRVACAPMLVLLRPELARASAASTVSGASGSVSAMAHPRTGPTVVGVRSAGWLARTHGGAVLWIDATAMDSYGGNLYTGEVWTGKRIQNFKPANGDGVQRFRRHE